MAETLELALLGNPELRLAGQPLGRFRSAKVYALLYYLAVTRRAQPRPVLAGLFWGDVDEYYARRNFSRTLSDLTQFVGDHLVIDRQTVTFARQQPYWLDVEDLENAATTAPTRHNVAALATAANRYRGDFLQGFYVQEAPGFEQWVLTERTRLRTAAQQLLHTLAGYHAEQRAFPQAIDYARRMLQLEPWHEEAHRQLMLLLAQSGQRAAALAQFELCRQALHSELDVEPDAATLDLVARIRAGKIDKVTSDKVTSDKVTSDKVTSTSSVTLSQPYPVTQSPWHNLPSLLTTFVGRRSEIETVKQLFQQHRLLTLTGPGGIGKTRLALQVAEEMVGFFPDGVCFVDLAPINEPALVINTIADVLGVGESYEGPLVASLQKVLRHKQFLLLLDNFEHLLDAAPLVSDLLASCHQLSILITSREGLALYGEQEYAVPPLHLPDPECFASTQQVSDAWRHTESLQLFERAAQTIHPTFRLTAENTLAVASICLRLDGVPLAIELAAAYTKLLSPQTILAQLDSMWLEMKRSLRNVPARQQTLRNTIEWSYRFLSDAEKQLFAQLAVFRGGCTWDAIIAICTAQSAPTSAQHSTFALLESLNGLVSKSLVRQRTVEQGEARFGMLETIREYALSCLQSRGELESLQERHARYYARLTAGIEYLTVKQRQIFHLLKSENDNFRVALRWSLTHDPEPGLQLFGNLGSSWRVRGHLTEGMNWAEQLLAAGQQAAPALRAKVYTSAALLAYVLGRRQQACHLADQGWLLAQPIDDQPVRAQTTFIRAVVRVAPNLTDAEYMEIAQLTNEAAHLFLALKDTLNYACTFNLLGDVERMQQRYAEAHPHYLESLRGFRQLEYQSGVAAVLANLGWVVYHQGDYLSAITYFAESIELAYDLGFADSLATALIGTAGALTRLQRPRLAAQLLGTAETVHKAHGMSIHAADEVDYQWTCTALTTKLGKAEFEHCRQKGRALDVATVPTLIRHSSGGMQVE